MNYGIIGSVGGVNSGTGKDSMTKQFLSQNRRALLGRNTRQHQAYMDKMQNSLNYCIQENMTPYWRNHQSLKGKLHFADKLHFRGERAPIQICLPCSFHVSFRVVLNELSDGAAKSIA